MSIRELECRSQKYRLTLKKVTPDIVKHSKEYKLYEQGFPVPSSEFFAVHSNEDKSVTYQKIKQDEKNLIDHIQNQSLHIAVQQHYSFSNTPPPSRSPILSRDPQEVSEGHYFQAVDFTYKDLPTFTQPLCPLKVASSLEEKKKMLSARRRVDLPIPFAPLRDGFITSPYTLLKQWATQTETSLPPNSVICEQLADSFLNTNKRMKRYCRTRIAKGVPFPVSSTVPKDLDSNVEVDQAVNTKAFGLSKLESDVIVRRAADLAMEKAMKDKSPVSDDDVDFTVRRCNTLNQLIGLDSITSLSARKGEKGEEKQGELLSPTESKEPVDWEGLISRRSEDLPSDAFESQRKVSVINHCIVGVASLFKVKKKKRPAEAEQSGEPA